MQDTVNAFVEMFEIPGAAGGPLSGLTFGAKDLYDIKGRVTGFGSPDWARTHGPATAHAATVQMLLDAGATLVGKTHTDEIAYSLMGVNAHYGAPINTKAPDRVPGGSSSGSVAATAAGLVDIGLGSDTGGSVRMPASYCGVFGLRPTHGRIDMTGAMPLAPTFDAAGWFARDGAVMARAGLAFGMDAPKTIGRVRLMIADDAMALALPATRTALTPTLGAVQDLCGAAAHVSMADGAFAAWREVFRVCQAAEVWQSHAAWVTATKPSFGPGVKERFAMAASITAEQLAPATARRTEIRAHLNDLLGSDGILLLPTGPGPAPRRDDDEKSLDVSRMAALELLCAAGIAGLPQISIPAGSVDGGPVGLSLIGASGADEILLAIARDLPPTA